MKHTINNHIGNFEKAVSKKWCEEVINIFEANIENSKTRQEMENGIPPIFKEDRSLSLMLLNSKLTEEFYTKLKYECLPLYLKESKIPELEPKLVISDYRIQKTNPTEGYHAWHMEHGELFPNRVMAYTVYLNDVEEGGETEFLMQSTRIKANQGKISIFPASYTHLHRGNPPISGVKYIMTGWVEYPVELKQ